MTKPAPQVRHVLGGKGGGIHDKGVVVEVGERNVRGNETCPLVFRFLVLFCFVLLIWERSQEIVGGKEPVSSPSVQYLAFRDWKSQCHYQVCDVDVFFEVLRYGQ